MSEIALAWEWTKGITDPIVGSTKIKHLESAVNSMDVELTLDEVNYFDELYVPHSIKWTKGITDPIVGSTKIKHLESAVNSMDVELTLDEVNYFDELYVPHSIIGAINQNPPEGTVVLDRK